MIVCEGWTRDGCRAIKTVLESSWREKCKGSNKVINNNEAMVIDGGREGQVSK